MDFRLALAFLLLTVLPMSATACECAFGPLVDRTVRDAKRILVVQLVSAAVSEVKRGPQLGVVVNARLHVVESLRGEAPAALDAWYSTLWCCGARLDLGH